MKGRQRFKLTLYHTFYKPNLTKIENNLTHWAQAGSNNEKKTTGRKSRKTVPLKVKDDI